MKMIKKNKCSKLAASLAVTVLLSLLAAAPVMAAGAATGPGKEIEEKAAGAGNPVTSQTAPTGGYNGDVNTLRTAAEADKLIVAVGNPADPAGGMLSYYEKDAAGILQPVFQTEAVSGMNGISADKVEGDKKTPQGVYSFTMAFGLKDNPGSILPYHKIVKGDHYVDDSTSRYYNRLVNEFKVTKDWSSSEDLMRQAPQYDYGLVLNYNMDYVPYKGSAIFLHCPKASNNTGTSGCISIPEELMRLVVTKADANTRIIVVPDASYLSLY